jgi:hypothetical protein
MASTIGLPNEIWLEVFSHLNYRNLKNCMRVCKIFKSLTDHSACQKTMFRSKAVVPKGGAIGLENVVLHPAFESMPYECRTSLDQVYFYTDDGDKLVLIDTCAANEHATCPPVALLCLQIAGYPMIQVRNKAGVTVLQVMKSVCRFFFQHPDLQAECENSGWDSWDEITLDRNDNLLLSACSYLVFD